MEPKVQIVCITYNHEKYIAEALNSFIKQKTNFKFEVLVGDDCSTDTTGLIVDDFVKKYPNLIKKINRETNLGPTRNLIDLCNHCVAPYIAFCEGDDYWIDEYKLQKQFDYMEKNPDVRVCFTQVEVDYPPNWATASWYKKIDNKIIIPNSIPGFYSKKYYRANDLVNFFPHTSSYFFRWNYELEIPDWFFDGYSGDIPILLMQLGKEKASLLPFISSVYRRSEVGIVMGYDKDLNIISTRAEYIRYLSELFSYFKQNFDGFACNAITSRIITEIFNLYSVCTKINDFTELVNIFNRYPLAMKIFSKRILQDKKKLELIKVKLGSKQFDTLVNNSLAQRACKYCINVVNGEIPLTVACIKLFSKCIFNKKKKNYLLTVLKKFKALILFNKTFYLSQYPDVADSGISPYKHYIKFGFKEGRKTHPHSNFNLKNIYSFLWYWVGALIPKKKNLWVFSSFYKKGYLDNTRYLYEYTVKKHPEIKAVWLTQDSVTFKYLESLGFCVKTMSSLSGRMTMLRASIAFTDHFRSSDYDNIFGFNARTKVVQLWHGVGLKNMQPQGRKIPNTTVPGVELSSDILCKADDPFIDKLKKLILYFFKAPFRELMEQYYGILCPGPERLKYIVDAWNIPHSSCIYAGQPRNINLHSESNLKDQKMKIIYAPTYRWNPVDEKKLIDSFICALPNIHSLMSEIGGEFVLRLHPHTWRNYQTKLDKEINIYSDIFVDKDKDIYQTISNYSVMISDYSSIAYDFLLLNRPLIFYVPDFENYVTKDNTFNYFYDEVTPGPKVRTWEEVICMIKESIEEPRKYEDFRLNVAREFYDLSVNNKDNSERIIQSLKKRLFK